MILNYLMVAAAAGMTGWCLGWSMCRAWMIAAAREYRQAVEHRAGIRGKIEELDADIAK